VYSIGQFNGTADFDPGPGIYNLTSAATVTNANNVFISKLDASGNFLWAKSIPNTDNEFISSVVLDNSGNLYAAGAFSATAVFDPPTGVDNLLSSGYSDFFIFKMNASGNFIWAKQIGNTNGESIITLTLGNSGLDVAGTFVGTVDFDPGASVYDLTSVSAAPDPFIARLDSSGNFLWAHKLSGGSGITLLPTKIKEDPFGNLYVAGVFIGTVDFDPGAEIHELTAINQNVFVFKLDPTFNFLWVSAFESSESEGFNSMILDGADNVYVAGSMRGTVDFDPGAGTYFLTSTGVIDDFTCKLNASGGIEWVNHIGNTQGSINKIALDISGNLYTTGGFRGTIDFDPGLGVYNLTAAGTNNLPDIYISKTDANGALLWAKSIGYDGIDYGIGIFVDASFNIYVTGVYDGSSVDFDPGVGIYNIIPSPNINAFVLKLAPPGVAPLTLLTFSAKAINDHEAVMQWGTAQEENTDKFIVERSSNQRDFASLGSVKAAGNSAMPRNYFFTDKTALTGTSFYRLKMMDNDGSFTYSETKPIRINKTTFHIIQIRPGMFCMYMYRVKIQLTFFK
jgi:hypothetical protein